MRSYIFSLILLISFFSLGNGLECMSGDNKTEECADQTTICIVTFIRKEPFEPRYGCGKLPSGNQTRCEGTDDGTTVTCACNDTNCDPIKQKEAGLKCAEENHCEDPIFDACYSKTPKFKRTERMCVKSWDHGDLTMNKCKKKNGSRVCICNTENCDPADGEDEDGIGPLKCKVGNNIEGFVDTDCSNTKDEKGKPHRSCSTILEKTSEGFGKIVIILCSSYPPSNQYYKYHDEETKEHTHYVINCENGHNYCEPPAYLVKDIKRQKERQPFRSDTSSILPSLLLTISTAFGFMNLFNCCFPIEVL